jgi:hypothetical protein
MIEIIVLMVVAFVQNMAFTWVSRSRNSGDPSHHRYAAYCSNGIWFITNILIWKQVWNAIESGNMWYLVAAGIAYTIATSEGSVFMMKRLLKTETGKRRVGAR